MDLLPKSSSEFSSESYWNSFFTRIKDDSFEWYGEYPELAELLHKYISSKDDVLCVGCGNSTLSHCLHKAGITKQTNIDISSVVVNQMKSLYPDMVFLQEDVTKMDNFNDESFSCVLDKGTFDALTPPGEQKTDPNDENFVKSKAYLMLEEISRVIKKNGRFICISLLQPHVAQQLFSFFSSRNWIIRVCRCTAVEEKAKLLSKDGATFPVFLNIFTKINLPPSIPAVIEASYEGGNMLRLKNKDDLLSFIENQQSMANLRRELLTIGIGAEKEVMLSLVSKTGEDRFLFYVTDCMKLIKNPVENRFGVFIVPEGRESEWLFGTHEGRVQLAKESNFTRLVVCHLVRGQKYESMEKIQEEITGHIRLMMPGNIGSNFKAPIMTISSDPGTRTIRFNGNSEFSGDFVVEDVLGEGGQFSRRLIFLNNPNVIQSEVGVQLVKKKGKEHVIFKRTLSCEHHKIMCIAFGIVEKIFKVGPNETIDALLIGLGGGLLAGYIVTLMPKVNLTAVEIDEAIVKVAQDYFGLPKNLDKRLQVVVDDGLKFLQSKDSQYNVILIDVDSKSISEGLSCPPPSFLEGQMLQQMKARLKPESGVLVLNLVCRNPTLKQQYIDFVSTIFPAVYSYQVGQDLNNLLFCFQSVPKGTQKQLNNSLKKSIEWLDQLVTNYVDKSSGNKNNTSEWMDDDITFIHDRFKLLKTES